MICCLQTHKTVDLLFGFHFLVRLFPFRISHKYQKTKSDGKTQENPVQTTPVTLESNNKMNDVDLRKNQAELMVSTITKEPTIMKPTNKEKDALNDVDKRTQETKDEIKIIDEVHIEPSHVNLRDMIKDRTKIDVKKRIRSMDSSNDNKNKNNQRLQSKDPEDEKPSTTGTKNDTIRNETVKVTKAGHKIKLIHEEEIQDNPLNTENTLKPMPQYVMTRRIGAATYPTGNA